jgi:hypothetical protein
MWDGFGNGSVINAKGKYDPGYNGVHAMLQGHYIANFNKVVNVGFGAVRRQALEIIAEHKGKIFGDWANKACFL